MEIINLLGDIEPVDSWYRATAESGSPYEARRCRMVLDFLAALRRDVIGPRLHTYRLNRHLWLCYGAPNGCRCSITLVIDHPDHGPLEDGMPRFHYRLECRVARSDGSPPFAQIEKRAYSVETACQFVREAIERARRGW